MPVAQRLLQTTDRAFQLVVSDKLARRAAAHARCIARVAAFAMRSSRCAAFAFRTMSQIGIRYRTARCRRRWPACRRPRRGAGDRFPWLRLGSRRNDLYRALDDSRFHLLVFGDAPAEDAGDMVRMHVVRGDPENERELARARHQPAVILPAAPRRPCRPVWPGLRRGDDPALVHRTRPRAPAVVNARDNEPALAYPGVAMNHHARHTLYVAVPTPGM